MPRPGLFKNLKFRRLADEMGGRPLAVGSLELLWYPSHRDGDPVIGDSFDVEARCEWRGERGALTRMLVEVGRPPCRAGFIERVVDHEEFFQIHDFWDHAPTNTRRNGINRGKLKARELPPGFVYVIRCGELYNIGYSVDPDRRLRSIPVAPEGPLNLILQIPAQNMRHRERTYHQRYASVFRFGEWYALEPWMLAELESEVPR